MTPTRLQSLFDLAVQNDPADQLLGVAPRCRFCRAAPSTSDELLLFFFNLMGLQREIETSLKLQNSIFREQPRGCLWEPETRSNGAFYSHGYSVLLPEEKRNAERLWLCAELCSTSWKGVTLFFFSFTAYIYGADRVLLKARAICRFRGIISRTSNEFRNELVNLLAGTQFNPQSIRVCLSSLSPRKVSRDSTFYFREERLCPRVLLTPLALFVSRLHQSHLEVYEINKRTKKYGV